MDIQPTSSDKVKQPLQDKQNLDMGNILSPLEQQRFQSKLNDQDLGQLRVKMTNEISIKPKSYNLKEALLKNMRTIYNTNTENKPMAQRSDIGMAEVIKAFFKMDEYGREGKSMEARPLAKSIQTVLRSLSIHRGRLSMNPSERNKKEFKQLLYKQYTKNNQNNTKSETEYFFSNFKAELHRFNYKDKPTIEKCELTPEGKRALRLFIDNIYEEYNNDPANKKNEVIAFFETMTSDPVSDDIRERTLSSLLMTETLKDEVKLEILLKLSCAKKILNNEMKVRLRDESFEGHYINPNNGYTMSTRRVRELVLKALKNTDENIKKFGELAIRSMEKIGSKEKTNKEQFVTSNRSDLPLLVDYLEEDEFTPEIYETIQRYILDLVPEESVSEVKLDSKQEALLDRRLDYEEKLIEDTLQYLSKKGVDENYFENEILKQNYLNVSFTLNHLEISKKIIDRCEKNQNGFATTRVLKEMLAKGLGNKEQINEKIDKRVNNIFVGFLNVVRRTTHGFEELLPNIIKLMKLDSDAIKRLNKTDINDISSWKREYIEIAEGFRHERMFKDDDQGKKILLTNYAKIFKAVGLAIPNGEDYQNFVPSNEKTKEATISLLNEIFESMNPADLNQE